MFVECRKKGAVLVDNLENTNITKIYSSENGEGTALSAEFKMALNDYLGRLVTSPVRSLSDVIKFNEKKYDLVRK